VTRVTRQGHRLGADNLRITAEQALAAHTINGALGREDELGSISPGKRADFVVLSADPLTVPAGDISKILVLETWVDGARVYAA
jgi:predicted amidohydrolase YtcJ